MEERETLQKTREREIKEERHSQCVVSHSHRLSATPGEYTSHGATETGINSPLSLKWFIYAKKKENMQ